MARSFKKPSRTYYNSQAQSVVNIQLAAWREQMLNRLLPWTAGVGTIAIIVGIISVIQRGEGDEWIYIPIYVGVYLVLVAITLVRKLSYSVKARMLLALAVILGIGVLYETGLSGVGRPFLLVLPVAAIVLIDWRFSLGSLALSTIILLGFGSIRGPMLEWVLAAAVNAMLGIGVIIALHTIVQNLSSTLEKEQRSRQQLRDISDHLEQKASKHTKELERRTKQLAVGTEISQAVTSQHDLTKLLTQTAQLLLAKLNFHHVSVLLMDANGESAELKAAAGAAAEEALEEGRVVQVGERSLAGWCLEKNEAQLRLDNSQLFHPLLPDTRSTMTLPLRVGKIVLGALEAHSTRPNAFEDSDVAALQNVADYIALIIQNARLAQQARNAIQELQTSNQLLARDAWQDYHLTKAVDFVEYHQAGQAPWSMEEMEQLIRQPVSHGGNQFSIPLTLYGAEIGHLVIELGETEGEVAEMDIELLHALADQIATALETARLLEESQRRAAHEQMMTKIGAQVRTSLDPDTILKTAVRELGRAVGARLTTVEVLTPQQNGNGSDAPMTEEA